MVADTFSSIASHLQDLSDIHNSLCHPGITCLCEFTIHPRRHKKYNFYLRLVYLKPKFLQSRDILIRAISPFQCLNIDFKSPLPASKSGNQYLLTIIDEYSRFPFAYACKDTSSRTVIHCLNQLFAIFGMPDMIHNDRATDFLSGETKQYLTSKGVATSKTSRYNPRCNGQVERLNGTLWKAIQVSIHSRKLKMSDWETILPDALHAIRSLLCTATNVSPHERLFNFDRRSTSGKSLPSWVKPGRVYVRHHSKRSKNDPPVSPATLIHANPEYAHIRLDSGAETTVNVRDLAPFPVVAPGETMDDFEDPSSLPVPVQENDNSQVH